MNGRIIENTCEANGIITCWHLCWVPTASLFHCYWFILINNLYVVGTSGIHLVFILNCCTLFSHFLFSNWKQCVLHWTKCIFFVIMIWEESFLVTFKNVMMLIGWATKTNRRSAVTLINSEYKMPLLQTLEWKLLTSQLHPEKVCKT